MKTDTIAAIATSMSNAGISIIRMSGEDSFIIIDKIFKSKKRNKKLSEANSHTAHYGYIMDEELIVDEVIVLIMKGPNSYTKENIVEIDCHGGVTVTKKILETVIKNGARPAEPGEFTKRAFLNGRIDLSQAEAVIDIIQAKNNYALQNSVRQLKGNILEKIKDVRENIIMDIAFIEAALDDPEHISVEGFSKELLKHVTDHINVIKRMVKSADNGRIIKEGIKTVIVGKPNVGKSSLLNILVGEERAIVTDIAGTTRDTLEEAIQLDEILLNVVDTAGIRDTKDIVERLGVEKAKKYAEEADLIIYVVDATVPLDENDKNIITFIKKQNAVVLLNKIDLNMVITKELLEEKTGKKVIPISAKEEKGLEELQTVLKSMFYAGKISFNDEIYITNIRHKNALMESLESLKQVLNSIEADMPEDFYSIDLMNAYEVLGEIIGESVGEDLVNTIFSQFCMGK